MAFRIGQRVVCVDDSNCMDDPDAGVRASIVAGQIYTIAWAGEHTGSYCVRLVGIKRQNPHWPDWPFSALRFRPVQERKRETDISIFLKILSPMKVEA